MIWVLPQALGGRGAVALTLFYMCMHLCNGDEDGCHECRVGGHRSRCLRNGLRRVFVGRFVMSFMLLLTAAIAHEDEDHRIFELYANFDISHLIRPGMNWYALLDIRQQLRRPSLAFYVDKVQYKTKMKDTGVDIPEAYYVANAEPDMSDSTAESTLQGIQHALAGRRDYVAKPTHMSCSDDVYVVKGGWNIYPPLPAPVTPAEVAATLVAALRRRSSLLGESWALHQVPPGVVIEERISADDEDGTAALEFKTIVIWGRVWAAEVRRGPHIIQALDRDGRCMHGRPLDPKLAHVDWPRVRELAERLGAHKDCFRVDIFVSAVGRASSPPDNGTATNGTAATRAHSRATTPALRYQLNEAEFYITSSMDFFDEAARLWLEGYSHRRYVVVPNDEVSGRYAGVHDPDPREEIAHFKALASELGWADRPADAARTYGSLREAPVPPPSDAVSDACPSVAA